MAETKGSLVVLMTHSADHELSSVGFTIACGRLTAGAGLHEARRNGVRCKRDARAHQARRSDALLLVLKRRRRAVCDCAPAVPQAQAAALRGIPAEAPK